MITTLHAGAFSFSYDLRLGLKTSFTGKDLLYTRMRAGNMGDANEFAGGGERRQPEQSSTQLPLLVTMSLRLIVSTTSWPLGDRLHHPRWSFDPQH